MAFPGREVPIYEETDTISKGSLTHSAIRQCVTEVEQTLKAGRSQLLLLLQQLSWAGVRH